MAAIRLLTLLALAISFAGEASPAPQTEAWATRSRAKKPTPRNEPKTPDTISVDKDGVPYPPWLAPHKGRRRS